MHQPLLYLNIPPGLGFTNTPPPPPLSRAGFRQFTKAVKHQENPGHSKKEGNHH
jgi:hypothetical protein